MKISIDCIRQEQHRYATLGDYFRAADGDVYIRVTDLPDWRHSFLIALHELVEEAVTYHRGISEPSIMAFDVAHPELDDPGMSPEAPYHAEHVLATCIEMLVARELDVDWVAYGEACAQALETQK